MSRGGTFSVSEFAEFSRTTRDTLLYYDKIGLLKPEIRCENNYRYYSSNQLSIINLIRTCQTLGMTLEEIKKIKESRSPEGFVEILDEYLLQIDEKIEGWMRAKKLLITLQNIIRSAAVVNEDDILVQYMKQEPIVLGEQNDYSHGRNDYDALFSFYKHCSAEFPEMDLNYPVWGMFSIDRIKRGDWIWPDRYYLFNPEGKDIKPASLYAIGYTRGGYGQSGQVYGRILEYIDANGFEITGSAYEEYILNEVTVVDEDNYLMRVMIEVEERKN